MTAPLAPSNRPGWWGGALAWLLPLARRRGWLSGVGALLLFGLLVLFHQVVRSAVQQGELRREATALHTAALFRCKALQERRTREACLQRLSAGPPDIAALRTQNALTIAALEQLNR